MLEEHDSDVNRVQRLKKLVLRECGLGSRKNSRSQATTYILAIRSFVFIYGASVLLLFLKEDGKEKINPNSKHRGIAKIGPEVGH